MARLFAANTLQQNFNFHYRVPENNRMLTQLIPSGGQKMVGDPTFTPIQIDQIIKDNEKYGMFKVDELGRAPKDQIISMVFSVDKEVPARLIQEVMQANRKELVLVGKETRQELAVVAANILGDKAPDGHTALSTAMTIDEEQPGTMTAQGGERLQEGFAGPESHIARQRNEQGAPPTKPRSRAR